jgi:flavodoxin
MNNRAEQKKGSCGLMVYSSKTGNTRKLAEGIRQGLAEVFGTVRIAAVEENPDPAGADWILVGFWADRGNADHKALQYLQSLEGHKIGLFGTLGASPHSDHAKDIGKRVQDLAAEKNTVLGCFLCQGRIDPALTEQFKTLPAGNPHAMTPDRMKLHEEAAKHPDEQDIQAAVAACLSMVKSVPVGGGGGGVNQIEIPQDTCGYRGGIGFIYPVLSLWPLLRQCENLPPGNRGDSYRYGPGQRRGKDSHRDTAAPDHDGYSRGDDARRGRNHFSGGIS